ncbi:hypothetical protein LJ753_10850 [Arthrobacter sp. zg-Y20]|uniref:hypothetical protein n=1 Tax=unclassified Arthrobacter TaxID=235627 RepID=UPI001D143894|nr:MULTISPECIES: hypothetical protein [unclassified Arthrobacter]MCC3276368.1 hypothetical protein [Arthrobacter sp. zg-Y20]MDK1316527.1 hypothetical protein [Arthrobacter sp. zg.Y20]WIB06568.1 hypothetical protein QNO06_02150 [Arthrobacter sp. zg-Y20]
MSVTLPLFINGVDYSAEAERRGVSGLLARNADGNPRTGVLGPPPTITISDNTVTVGQFSGAIGTPKGAYLLGLDSATLVEGTIGAADSTNPRRDRIVLEVLDPDNGSGGTDRKGRLRLVPGTASAGAGLPPLQARQLHVGSILTPRANGGNPSALEDPFFTAAAGAPVPVRDAADLGTLLAYPGALALRLDRQGALMRAAKEGNGVGWYEPGGVLGYRALSANSQLAEKFEYVELPAFSLDFTTSVSRAVAIEFSGVLSAIAGSTYFFDVRLDGVPVRRSEVVVTSTRVETGFSFTGRRPALAAGNHQLRVYGAQHTGAGAFLLHGPTDNYGATYVAVRDDGVGAV